MDFIDAEKQAADCLVGFALSKGYDIARYRCESLFVTPTRTIDCWLEDDGIGYHLWGQIGAVPKGLGSSFGFDGVWDEAGSVKDLAQAFQLLRSWLINGKEVGQLPQRTISRSLLS